MINCNLKNVYKFFLTITIIAMTIPSNSQNVPASDTINTSAGIVKMHFIGHGSLMFEINGFIIYFDPVRSSGSYDNLPKADLILVTHEHGDHLDIKLVDELKKPGTVMYCNELSASKVAWAKKIGRAHV